MKKTLALMALSWSRFEFSKDCVNVRERTYDKEFHAAEHSHDFCQMIYCKEGSYVHTIGNKACNCSKSSLAICAPGVRHSFNVSPGTTLVYIEIAYNAFTAKSPRTYASTVFFAFAPFFDENFNVFLEDMVLPPDLHAENNANPLPILEEFFSSTYPLSKEDCEKIEKIYNSKLAPIINALDYLNTHYAQKIRCDDILRKVLLCSTDFYNYFKAFTGTTYSIYLQMVRVTHAHRAIAFTPYSLSYIANMCGFGDNTYMTKCYKKFKGYTPSEERPNLSRNKEKWAHLKISHDFFDI